MPLLLWYALSNGKRTVLPDRLRGLSRPKRSLVNNAASVDLGSPDTFAAMETNDRSMERYLSPHPASTRKARDKSCLCWCSGCSRSISQHMKRRSCGVAIQIVEAVVPSRSRRHHSNCTSSHDVRTRETRVRLDLDSFFACGARQPMLTQNSFALAKSHSLRYGPGRQSGP